MKIRYQPRTGISGVEIRGVGDQSLVDWRQGEVKDVPDDQQITVIDRNGETHVTRAVDVVLGHGPDFVDAETGVNPNYQCHDCGAETLEITHLDRANKGGGHRCYRVDAPLLDDPDHVSKPKLCITCYLVRHPEWIAQHRADGTPESILRAAAARLNGDEPDQSATAAPAQTEALDPHELDDVTVGHEEE